MENKWEEIKNILEEDERMRIALDSLAELAKGIYYEKETLTGAVKIFKREPSREAAQFLINLALKKIYGQE